MGADWKERRLPWADDEGDANPDKHIRREPLLLWTDSSYLLAPSRGFTATSVAELERALAEDGPYLKQGDCGVLRTVGAPEAEKQNFVMDGNQWRLLVVGELMVLGASVDNGASSVVALEARRTAAVRA